MAADGQPLAARGQIRLAADTLARAATPEPVPAVVRPDARDFRGMELESTSRKQPENGR
jgi:hypothetical protein